MAYNEGDIPESTQYIKVLTKAEYELLLKDIADLKIDLDDLRQNVSRIWDYANYLDERLDRIQPNP